jgi:hypothetical protein
VAPATLSKPLGATAALRVGPVEDLVPPGKFRVVCVGKMLDDDALKIGVDHGPKSARPSPTMPLR